MINTVRDAGDHLLKAMNAAHDAVLARSADRNEVSQHLLILVTLLLLILRIVSLGWYYHSGWNAAATAAEPRPVDSHCGGGGRREGVCVRSRVGHGARSHLGQPTRGCRCNRPRSTNERELKL